MALENIPELSLRQLKSALYVAQTRNLTRAAKLLNRSQTAITKAVSDLEETLGKALFDRSTTGMQPTVYGEAIARRVETAAREFEQAGEGYLKYMPNAKSVSTNPVFSMDISYKRVAALIALYETRNISAAALELGVTKTAIYNSVRQLEQLLELSLFEREPHGVSPTAYCRVLIRHTKLAFAEIRRGIEDLSNIDGITKGRLAIGTLPYTRTLLTPRAINRLLEEYPKIDISTREGPYQTMEIALRSGEIDCIVGALRTDSPVDELETEELFQDKLAVIARFDHPLAAKKSIALNELSDLVWVLPARNTPSRKLFNEALKKQGIGPLQRAIETSSVSMVRGLLLDSDQLALLSEHQIHYDKKFKLLTALPVDLGDTMRPIGVTTLRRTQPAPAVELFLRFLRESAGELRKSI